MKKIKFKEIRPEIMKIYRKLMKEVNYDKKISIIPMPKIYEEKYPKSLPNAFPTFPKIWSRAMLCKYWDARRRVFFVYIAHEC